MEALVYSKNAHGKVSLIIHPDNAKEYLEHATVEVLAEMRTLMRSKIPYSPEENGIAERIN